MEWIQFYFESVELYFPFYIIGSVICGIVWFFTRRLRVFPKVVTRSLLLALLLAPGALVGHGAQPAPAILAVRFYLIHDHSIDASFQSTVPIFVVWLVSVGILFVIAHFARKKPDEKSAAVSHKV